MVNYTSIQILPKTRQSLARLKSSPRETYDDVINKLLELVPEGDEEGKYADEFRVGLLNARIELKTGRKVPLSEAKKALGL
ncbi:MAG: hypothetical protein J7K68_01905 [Candidatus Diapherotrites archaeon]|nr:hypothetical protein [Candidatus Diapherotrites archaeon]